MKMKLMCSCNNQHVPGIGFLEIPVMGTGNHAQKILQLWEKSWMMQEMLQGNLGQNEDTETGYSNRKTLNL